MPTMDHPTATRTRGETGASNKDLQGKADSIRQAVTQRSPSRDHPDHFEALVAVAKLRLSDAANSEAIEAILAGGAPRYEASCLRPEDDRDDGKDLLGRPPLTPDENISNAGKLAKRPPVAPPSGAAAPRKMMTPTDMVKHVRNRKSSTQRDPGVLPLTRNELGLFEFQEGTTVMVNTLRFERPARLRRGTIASFAKYPPYVEPNWNPISLPPPQGQLCHRYMVIMDDTREVLGPFRTVLGEILPANGLMSAKLNTQA
ncbi:hypothetical protein TRAPUB_4284 [Trametes pubescens]|uniref:Uncharacterized protein n=1 Tax=Trametes pubescens TaxID=154538 RepID=A0A1M2VBH4_TRAPU|nr:hypothetical protein TRAPUB_4284 [Trametes pubescens]